MTIPAGLAVATITFPAASSGSGTLQLTGSTVLPTPGPSATGATSTVSIPGTAIAAITIATSMSATYATLPTFSFALPAATNESYELYIDDPATGVPLFPVGAYAATSSATGVTLTAQTAPIAAPYPAGAPPILPITYDANNTVGFVLYETPATN